MLPRYSWLKANKYSSTSLQNNGVGLCCDGWMQWENKNLKINITNYTITYGVPNRKVQNHFYPF